MEEKCFFNPHLILNLDGWPPKWCYMTKIIVMMGWGVLYICKYVKFAYNPALLQVEEGGRCSLDQVNAGTSSEAVREGSLRGSGGLSGLGSSPTRAARDESLEGVRDPL